MTVMGSDPVEIIPKELANILLVTIQEILWLKLKQRPSPEETDYIVLWWKEAKGQQ